MARIAPPPLPPLVALEDDDNLKRLRLRLWLVTCTVLTVLITSWCIALGPIPGIIAVVTAKHVLVALLVVGLGVDAPRQTDL
jgi:hypothetical protein